jgi:hypothetical protein
VVALGLVLSTSVVAGGGADAVGISISLTPVLLGGGIAGYLAAEKTDLVGKRVGLLATIPAALWILVTAGPFLAIGPAGPPWFRVFGLVLLVLAIAMQVVLGVALGMIGAYVGGALA